MAKNSKINFCKGVIIAHGKCELLLAEYIKSNLHLPIEIYAENNGKTSIQIDSLNKVLGNNIFKNKSSLKKKYAIEEENGNLLDFFVMPIMDLDDTNSENITNYKNGDMFKNHWLHQYIVPIWNDRNLDSVLLELGIIDELPNNRNKGKIYRNIFPKNKGELDKDQIYNFYNTLKKSSKTNLDEFLKKCLDNLK